MRPARDGSQSKGRLGLRNCAIGALAILGSWALVSCGGDSGTGPGQRYSAEACIAGSTQNAVDAGVAYALDSINGIQVLGPLCPVAVKSTLANLRLVANASWDCRYPGTIYWPERRRALVLQQWVIGRDQGV